MMCPSMVCVLLRNSRQNRCASVRILFFPPGSFPGMHPKITQVGVGQGGPGMLAPGARAALDFVLRMTRSMRYAREEFRAHRDLRPIKVHPSVTNLFDPTYSGGSSPTSRKWPARRSAHPTREPSTLPTKSRSTARGGVSPSTASGGMWWRSTQRCSVMSRNTSTTS